MNKISLATLQKIINEQISGQETVLHTLFKAGSLLKVLLNSDLQAHSPLTLHSYLLQLSDTVGIATVLSEQLLDILLRIKILEPPKSSSGEEPPSSPPEDTTVH